MMATENSESSFDVTRILNADLYPDIIDFGGLVFAVQEVARVAGLDLGVVGSRPGEWQVYSADMTSPRGPVSVVLGLEKRLFSITLGSGTGNYTWATGGTDDLTAVARMIDAWRRGITLCELSGQFPFMTYSRISQAYEDGNQVSVQWDILLSAREDYIDEGLLLAAASEPLLRQLFPYFSHGTLCLDVNSLDRSEGRITLTRREGGGYRVESSVSGVRCADESSLGAAICAAVEFLSMSR